MAAVSLIPANAGKIDSFIHGNELGWRFLQLFGSDASSGKSKEKKTKKSSKSKGKDKAKVKRDKSPEHVEAHPPYLELPGNPSAFSVFASVRQAVLENQMKEAAKVYMQSVGSHHSDSECEDDMEEKLKDAIVKMPKIVSIGLVGVFEIIRETRKAYPAVCMRALQSLLDMLQGLGPEALKSEPNDVIDSLYQLLMEISTVTEPAVESAESSTSDQSLTGLACSCLLSLVIARGDTGKLLSATAAMLMSPGSLSSQKIKVPGILTSLQRSVQAVLLGKTQPPDWLLQGIHQKALTDTALIQGLGDPVDGCIDSAIASDGPYLYIHNNQGLHKVGSGYGGTIKGCIVMSRPDFHVKEKGWLAFCKDTLFYKAVQDTSCTITSINTETLEVEKVYSLEAEGYGQHIMFSDGEHIGHVAASKDDSFVVRLFSPVISPMPLVGELALKLARKCLDVFGTASFDSETEIHTIVTSYDEDSVSIMAGKDFALIKTVNGKILYSGKSQSLGIKQGGPVANKWQELPVTKSPKIAQYSVGHEGQHALLVAEDGSTFFVGTPKRGEDGDASLSKGRRQPKPVKPKKMIKLESKNIVNSACNNGTSAVVTKDGEVYMFGKDTTHCDHASGHVTDLRDVVVTQTALGKAHAVAMTNKGQVYTFGINNKGQCGREYHINSVKEVNNIVTMADDEDETDLDDMLCPPGKHKWKHDQCMVCTVCGECTGYGNNCISSDRPDRNPGIACGCGSGDSGCAECGVCRSCAGEMSEQDRAEAAAAGGLLEVLAKSREVIPIDLLIGRHGARNLDQLNRKLEERRNRVRAKVNRVKAKDIADIICSVIDPQPENENRKQGRIKASRVTNNDHDQEGDEVFEESDMANAENIENKKVQKADQVNAELDIDHAKLVSLPPAQLTIGNGDIPAIQIACGLQHTVVLLENGEVYTFGGNQYGQLGLGDTNIRGVPTRVLLKTKVTQVAAGSHHTVVMTASGQVYTFGAHSRGQLGRPVAEENRKEKRGHWFALPGLVQGIGAKHGRRATWIGASGDQTFLRIDESLISAYTLAKSNIFANSSCIGLIPREDGGSSMKCLMINTADGSCRSFNGGDQADLTNHSVCLDTMFNVLWSYSPGRQMVSCYNVISCEVQNLQTNQPALCNIISPELSVPVKMAANTTRSHSALHVLGCLDTLTTAQQMALTVFEEEKEKQANTKVYAKEDFSVLNRFESHGGGWGYSGHSIEAIRFMADSDLLIGGFGLFGGRGEYFGKIKIFELGADGGENEVDGDCLVETDEVPYECGAREKYSMLFDEPVAIQANHWYVAWARVSGPSSDCGSSGQSIITTDDQVVFKFKSSKKSNNGTDVNAGQIPQILYRIPAHDISSSSRKMELAEPAHVLSRDFSHLVAPHCFEALLKLLQWSWTTFNMEVTEIHDLKGDTLTATLIDLERLVYISTACLRLIRAYIVEVYPSAGITKKTPAETSRLAECVGDARSLLRKILSRNRKHMLNSRKSHARDGDVPFSIRMSDKILDECHNTFTACFHAFFPTPSLKWMCLVDLLMLMEPGQNDVEGCGRLLAAVMEALCHPTVKLTLILPVNCEHETEQILKKQYGTEDNTNSAAQSGSAYQFPLLVTYMTHRTQVEGGSPSHSTFKEILDRLLTIVVLPVRQALNQERVTYPGLLVSNTCCLLSSIVSELSAAATGSEMELTGSSRPLLMTPGRFTRTSQSAYWNTGNGSPDAVCFMVDRPGIVIAGVCVYGGGGSYDFDLELLDDQSDSSSDPSHTQRWNTIEITKGTYGPEDLSNETAELKFDRPVPIKEGVKYALRLRNRGPRTLNGDGGMTKVKCPDGTVFTFSACSLSSNGTNHCRGQIPNILYYSSPQDGENQLHISKLLAENQARKNAISITGFIIRAATDLLYRAQSYAGENVAEVIGSAHIFTGLLPLVLAYIGPIASQDPRSAVQVLNLVQEILPPVAELCLQVAPPASPQFSLAGENGSLDTNGSYQHYATVESEHPYKPATVASYKVKFPDSVQWLALEFDPQCGTAQVEDSLQLSIPVKHVTKGGHDNDKPENQVKRHCPVLQKYHGTKTWPGMAVILPGNEVYFSLETASDYVKDDKASFYGFKCSVVGYEWSRKPEEGVLHLEKEISYLGGICAASLMKKDMVLPPTSVEEVEEDMELIEDGAQQVFQAHSTLLSRGFALSHPPSITQALDGSLPFSWQSNERAFLKDFVTCATGTSGGRLAAWLQPDSYLDPKQCDIVYSEEDLKCSWPSVLTIQTKDQYGQLVNVQNLRVEVKAVPIDMKDDADNRKMRRLSRSEDTSMTYGGHPPPKLDVAYQVTIKEKKEAFHAICMMKAYENYSFEELRFAAPTVRRPSENMLVRSNGDGTYTANWTPGSVGWYNIHVSVDGFTTGETCKVEVKEAPQGVTPPTQNSSKKLGHQPNKMRKFVAKYSAGLRVRLHPSLQSEQIGIIEPNGTLTFIDEIHNDDGVWLRLGPDSIKQWCNNGFSEAWALQYNQHLGKTLLVPVDEPRSILDEIIKETVLRRLPRLPTDLLQDKPATPAGGPGQYQVVNCGASGHNIRCRPSLKATPIGMLVLSNQLVVTEDHVNSEGTWVKLDVESMQKYCHELDGEAWSLARDTSDILYIQSAAEISTHDKAASAFSFDMAADSSSGAHSSKGFDFTSAPQTPTFSVFGSTSAGPENLPAFGQQSQPPASAGHSRTSLGSPHSSNPSSHTSLGERSQQHPPGSPQPGGSSSASLPPSTSSSSSSASASTKPPERKESYLKEITDLQDIPPELHGVSVKDLVKALGKVRADKEINRTVSKPREKWSEKPSQANVQGKISTHKTSCASRDPAELPLADLKGLTVRDLVRLIGESRANGNGATPPRTPPGTPKKTPSRSSSPKAIPGSPRRDSYGKSSAPSSSSPRRDSLVVMSSPSPPRTPPTLRRDSSASSFTTPPQTPPSARKESPKLCSPARSPQRSASSSPHRSCSPLSRSSASASGPSGSPTRSPAMASGQSAGHFSIGASSPKEDIRLSPKAGRKDRGRQLRSKRERASSPAPKDLQTQRTRSSSGSLLCEKAPETVKDAMSPSVAECMRAVFAAFLWHEGIVHDAMACASFLKFHPKLHKEIPKTKQAEASGKMSKKSHARQASGGHHNININEFMKEEKLFTKARHHSEKTEPPPTYEARTTTKETRESELPPTLQHLVSLWEELSSTTFKVISQNLILPSPAVNAKSRRSERRDREKDKEKKGKKRKEVKVAAAAAAAAGGAAAAAAAGAAVRGNLFGEAADSIFGGGGGGAVVGGGSGERETMCELCGGSFPHPVTYHMRQTHPGCGRHAGGQGYNSGGNFCGGWAGNCGDGGIGGSTWYLMCDRCREKYLRDKRQANSKEKNRKTKKKSLSGLKSVSSTAQVLEPHIVMKNNAMFLLDLASAAGITLPSHNSPPGGSSRKLPPGLNSPYTTSLDSSLPSVTEDSLVESCPFPPTPFLYMHQRGASGADSAFAEDIIFDEPCTRNMRSESQGEMSRTRFQMEMRPTRFGRTGSMSQANYRESRSTRLSPQDVQSNIQMTKSAEVSPESDLDGAIRPAVFQRSISEITSHGLFNGDDVNVNNRVMSPRRRNNSGGISEGGMSLLKHPSAAMARLIESVEKAQPKPTSVDKTLQRSVMSFIIQRHDLDSLLLAMKQALRKAACRVHALQALNWLLRSVTQATCLHDLLWFFVLALMPQNSEVEEEKDDQKEKKEKKENDVDKEVMICEHPLSDITIAGDAVYPLPVMFHTYLQTVSDVMMYLPASSTLQQMAVRNWCLQFQNSDHLFLHKSHVFSNISKILSKSDEALESAEENGQDSAQMSGSVESWKDLTPLAELKASSRQAMIASLTDNSTETFWESGDEDRNKTKSITVTFPNTHYPAMLYAHIDNSRDLGNKVSSAAFCAGSSADDLHKLSQVDIESRHSGWVGCPVPNRECRVLRLEMRGPDNTLRLRQVKVLGLIEGTSLVCGHQLPALVLQQRNCEAETLKVFRLLTSQVFGKLITTETSAEAKKNEVDSEMTPSMDHSDNDLKEHMVGILFSRSKLSHLQKQVCAHIVQAIRKEMQRVREEWEAQLYTGMKPVDESAGSGDAYCFELLSMVLALSGSDVGQAYLAEQHHLLQDLIGLLHTASPRVQRQVTSLLRRVLPGVKPAVFASLMSVTSLPPKDFSILTNSEKNGGTAYDPDRVGILDVFLACIAKALTVQTKVKGQAGGKGVTSVRLSDCLPVSIKGSGRWWMRGTTTKKLASTIIKLLKDMAAGKLSADWAAVTKGAIAENILALTKLEEEMRAPSVCIRTTTMWLLMASLCVLDQDHVERLSSGLWVGGSDGQTNQQRPVCDNHDDGETPAIILCNECGNLCAECDRFLHLHRRTKAHQRQVFKEEEDAIKVDLHEGCGRTKLFWVMALADSKTLKGMVEFREGTKGNVSNVASVGTCRFCGATNGTGILAIGNVCADPECQEHARNACSKVHMCKHPCGGIKDEEPCLPCLHGCRNPGQEQMKQDADDMCMICFTEALSAAPAIQLRCGHVFHLHCCKAVLSKKWVGPRITFGFSCCPICKSRIEHTVLNDLLGPIKSLYDDVRRKALMRLEYEGLHKAEAITTVGARFYNEPAEYAMVRYAYYVCFKCQKAYYGGEARCEDQAEVGDEYDPSELVCGGCSDVSRAQMCPKHGTDFLEYKCRYCCSVAVFFCFGTTHFCNACHDDFQRVTNIPRSELPRCPAGPKGKQLEGEECPLHVQHPPTGEEFALGCGVCRNAHTF